MDLTIDTIVFVTVVALGGSIGALGRYALGELARVWSGLPGWVAILVANLLGCVLIGVSVALLESTVEDLSPHHLDLARGLLIAGVCGSLTTFSTFSRDTLMLYYEGRSGLAVLNVIASLLGGLAGTAIALRLGGAW